MGQINKIPLGYLNMLGSQTGGKNPFDAGEVVTPTIEMEPFYRAQGLKAVSVNYAPVGNLSTQFIKVPEGESWFLYFIANVETTVLGTDSVRWVNYIRSLPGSDIAAAPVGADESVLGAAASVAIISSVRDFSANPLPLVSGVEITQQVVDVVNPRNMFLTVLVASFRS